MDNFAAYLKQAGKTRRDFAKSIGISAPYLSQILSGRKRPSLDLAFRIEAATDGAVRAESWISADAENRRGAA